ncbi:CUB and sushi domain-containing protein 1-like isoform X2 [Pecten maximus]|uniref:CUB and sushi domain-containing protein 1-like isoform X2 n=1 Tax=Pecten maximus TaxID=6579 RepID=UPI001458520D|nr:CUB and sushi domain-containing protein 1-like isoform X2 [Pecten maximus]
MMEHIKTSTNMESKTLLLILYMSYLTCGIELNVPQFIRNFYLSSTGYLSISEVGLYSCARYCGMESDCKSFTYNTTDLRCRLIEDDVNTKPGKFGATPRNIYGDRATVISDESLMGTCRDHVCPDYTTCVRLSSGSRVCVITACGPTKEISYRGPENADNVSDTITPVGIQRYLLCDTGYIGYKTVVCLASGNWSEPELHCTDCGNPHSVSNAIISAGNTTIGSTRTYECIPTSTTSGSGDITCQPNGTWSGSSLECIPDCVIVSSMQNAITTATVAPAGTTISYTCDVGYVLASGTGNRHCNTQGSWEALDIVCDPVVDIQIHLLG